MLTKAHKDLEVIVTEISQANNTPLSPSVIHKNAPNSSILGKRRHESEDQKTEEDAAKKINAAKKTDDSSKKPQQIELPLFQLKETAGDTINANQTEHYQNYQPGLSSEEEEATEVKDIPERFNEFPTPPDIEVLNVKNKDVDFVRRHTELTLERHHAVVNEIYKMQNNILYKVTSGLKSVMEYQQATTQFMMRQLNLPSTATTTTTTNTTFEK